MRGNNDLLILTPARCDRATSTAHYLAAGADIVATNTFSSTSIAQADYGMRGVAYELNRDGAQLAREAAATRRQRGRPAALRRRRARADQPHRLDLAGREQSGFRAVTFDELRVAYGEQMQRADRRRRRPPADRDHLRHAERQGGDLRHRRDLRRARGVDVPVMISGTITDLSGRTLSGQTPEAFWNSVRHAKPLTVGLNCALGAEEMRAHIAELGRVADTLVCAYPNAGLPNEFGQYDESPEYMARLLGEFAGAGLVNIVGGCCGTTPDHIAAIAAGGRAARRRASCPRSSRGCGCRASSRSTLTPDNPVRQCRRAHQRHRLGEVPQADHRRRLRRGARRSRASRSRTARRSSTSTWTRACSTPKQAMVTFLNLIAAEPDIARVPVMVDSLEIGGDRGRAEMRAGQADRQLDLDEGRRGGVHRSRRKIVRRYGAAVVVMAFDEQGQADTLAAQDRDLHARLRHPGRTRSASRRKTSSSIRTSSRSRPASRSTTTTASTSSRRRAGSAQNLPHAHVSGGVSNLSFSFRGNEPVREAMHSVFLYHAIKAGMDMGIVNAGAAGGL